VNRPGEVTMEGVIESVEYYGLYLKYYIRVGGAVLKAVEKNDGVNIYEPGQQVTLALDMRDIMSYPRLVSDGNAQ